MTVCGVFREAKVEPTGSHACLVQQFDLTQAGRIVDPTFAFSSGTAGFGFPKEIISCCKRLDTGAEAFHRGIRPPNPQSRWPLGPDRHRADRPRKMATDPAMRLLSSRRMSE